MVDKIKLDLGPLNGEAPRRSVTLRAGRKTFRGLVDPASPDDITAMLDRAAPRLGIERSRLAPIAQAIREAAGRDDAAPDVEARRARLLHRIRRALVPKFAGATQYGREDSQYDLVFECDGARETVKLKSTAELLSKARVQIRLVEKVRGAVKVSQKRWPSIARMILRVAEVRPGLASEESVLDKLRDYLRQKVAPQQCDGEGQLVPLDPQVVVSRGAVLPDDDYAGRFRLRDISSFVGTDGNLYLKLSGFQTWLAQEWNRIPETDLTPALARLGFLSGSAGKVRATVRGQVYEARYWVMPHWDHVLGSTVMGAREV